MFTKAIVKTPCRNMINGLSNADLGKPDFELALTQHKTYIRALQECGLDVTILDPDENFPDSTFIEDTCLLTPRCAVITLPGAVSRRDEILSISETIKGLGLPVEKIQLPGTLEAGDVMMVGDHFFTGISDRTNREGALQLNTCLQNYDLTASSIELKEMLHLKTGISYLEHNNLLATGEFLTTPELIGFTILPVDSDESYAANSVWINERVLVPKGFPKTCEMIKSAGYETIEIDVSEFRKLDGGLSCLSLRF